MCRNADKLYYPIVESIKSALPLVDEYIVALGNSDRDDHTREIIESISSDKLKIIHTEWDLDRYPNGMVHAQQTDLAKNACTGDWLLYLQADELIHEAQHERIAEACESNLDRPEVEAFVLDYYHFWGDYWHLVEGHNWYDREVRIIRNDKHIHSWQSAQGFRYMPEFDGISYRSKRGTRKLNAKLIHAHVYHYGWVRPPKVMTKKRVALDAIHSHKQTRFSDPFDYGDLSRMKKFSGSHPAAMFARIADFNWADQLLSNEPHVPNRAAMKHERLGYQLLSAIESNLLGGRKIAAHENYRLLK